MPSRALRKCKEHECNHLTQDASGYYPEHIYLVEELKKQRWHRQETLRGSARQRGYTVQWEKARKVYLSKNPLCVECLKEGRLTPAKVIDHIIPHRGNRELFWDENNWQSLCTMYHNRKTARGE